MTARRLAVVGAFGALAGLGLSAPASPARAQTPAAPAPCDGCAASLVQGVSVQHRPQDVHDAFHVGVQNGLAEADSLPCARRTRVAATVRASTFLPVRTQTGFRAHRIGQTRPPGPSDKPKDRFHGAGRHQASG
jgi:hypothetical protein